MEDNQVFDIVNCNHQCQDILDRIVIDLDIIDLRSKLNAISARRRKRKCTELAHIVVQILTRVSGAIAKMQKMMKTKKRRCPPAPPQIPSKGESI